MMMQSVPTQDSFIVGRGQGFGTKANRTKESEFEKFFGNSIKKEVKVSTRAKAYESNHDNEKKANSSAGEDTVHRKDNDSGISNDKQSTKISERKSFTKADDKSIDKDRSLGKQSKGKDALENTDSVLAEQFQAILSQIRNAIMEELKLTPEEMDQMMADLDLDLTDLTDSQAILQLVMTNSGATDSTTILVDEELADTFQSLLNTVNDLKKDLPSELTDDQIKSLLELNSEDLSEPNEISQPLLNQKSDTNESGDTKDRTYKFQLISEDGDINEKSRVVVENDSSNLADTKDSEDGLNDAEGFDAFLDKLSANYEKPFVDFTGDNVRQYEVREIAKQIIEQIRVVINPKQTSMELQLNPEHLGKVNLTVSSKDGVMSAHFVVQNDLAKEAVESQMITLKETLAQQGIKVETIEVTVASYSFEQNNQSDEANQMMQKKQRGRQKITFEEAIAMSEEPLEVDDTMNHNGVTGYTVDYTA